MNQKTLDSCAQFPCFNLLPSLLDNYLAHPFPSNIRPLFCLYCGALDDRMFKGKNVSGEIALRARVRKPCLHRSFMRSNYSHLASLCKFQLTSAQKSRSPKILHIVTIFHPLASTNCHTLPRTSFCILKQAQLVRRTRFLDQQFDQFGS